MKSVLECEEVKALEGSATATKKVIQQLRKYRQLVCDLLSIDSEDVDAFVLYNLECDVANVEDCKS